MSDDGGNCWALASAFTGRTSTKTFRWTDSFKACHPGKALRHSKRGGLPESVRLTRRCSRRAALDTRLSRDDHHARLAAERRSVSPMNRSIKNPPIDPEALKPYFYWLGLTFHSCHQLEYGVKTVLVMMADMGFGGFDLNEMIAIMEDEKKKTLGQVLALVRQQVKLSDGWAESLTRGLDARNRFVHRFLSEVDERLANPGTRTEVVAEVKAIRKVVLEADVAVQQILETLCEHAGLSWRDLRSQWAEEMRAMNVPAASEPSKPNGAG